MNASRCETHAHAPQPRFRFGTRFLFFMTACACWFVFVGHKLYGPALPKHVLNRIQIGMTKDEVQAILGSPQDTSEFTLYYWRSPNPGWVEIWFDENGRVSSVNDESVFP